MRRRQHTDTRYCIACSAGINRGYAEGAARYMRRLYCGQACALASRRVVGKPRREQRNPERVWQTAKLSPLAVKTMRELRYVGRMKYHELGRMFGVSYSATWNACNQSTWGHVR